MTEYRCSRCGWLLFRAEASGRVEIVCHNRQCKKWQAVSLASSHPLSEMARIG